MAVFKSAHIFFVGRSVELKQFYGYISIINKQGLSCAKLRASLGLPFFDKYLVLLLLTDMVLFRMFGLVCLVWFGLVWFGLVW